MDMMQSISTVFSKYITFAGRAQRSEYWWFILFILVGSAVAAAFDTVMGSMNFTYGSGIIGAIFSLAIFLPSWAVEVRRLHDIGKSGWWLLLILIPIIGSIILLVWLIRKGTEGDNQYGPDPLA